MQQVSTQARLLKYYTLFGFFVIGVVCLLLGQILPLLSSRLELNDAEAGTLFLAQFSGSILGTLGSTRIAKRYGFSFAVMIGFFLIIIGLPGVNAGTFALCWLSVFVFGSGLGVTIPSINLLTIETTEPRLRSSAVNLINFSWGLGAICSQPFVAAASQAGGLVTVTVILDAAVVLLAICFYLAVRASSGETFAETGTVEVASRIWRRPLPWLFVAFSFFVVSIEGGLGGWLTTYTEDLNQNGVAIINLTVVYFFLFVVGRGVASVISRRVSENALIFLCSLFLLGGVLMLVSSDSLAVVGAAIAGLGSSAIFPTNMARFARVFGPTATLQAAPIFIAGTMGAAVISSLVGFISSIFDSLRTGIMVVLISAVFVVVLNLVIAMVFKSAEDTRAQFESPGR
jgi:fucose permease